MSPLSRIDVLYCYHGNKVEVTGVKTAALFPFLYSSARKDENLREKSLQLLRVIARCGRDMPEKAALNISL